MAKTPKLDLLERVEVTSRAEWRAWLKKNRTRTVGIWLVSYKKVVPEKYLSWNHIVEEALCFGWIDSTARGLDAERSMIYVCPRKPKSVWSKVNKARVEELIASKRMAAQGMKVIDLAKANGSWTSIDAVEALVIPNDMAKAFLKNKTAQKYFDAFPTSSRRNILMWVTGAKTDVTRTRRIEQAVALAAKNIRANQPVVKRKA